MIKKKVNGISFISVQLSSKLPQREFNEYGVRIIKSSNLMKFKKRKKKAFISNMHELQEIIELELI